MSFEHEMEHAAHAGGHGDHGDGKPNIGKFIGMTMAVLGVMLALSSALLGGSRNKLVTTMVEQNTTAGRYQAVSMKHRTLVAQLQQLHALLPADFQKAEKEIDGLATAADPAQLAAIKVMRLETAKILNTVTPTGSDVLRFVELVRDYAVEKEKAEKWAESYEDLARVYEEAGEHYEWGQLCAEFGIVLASIALLLQARPAWFGSVGFGSSRTRTARRGTRTCSRTSRRSRRPTASWRPSRPMRRRPPRGAATPRRPHRQATPRPRTSTDLARPIQVPSRGSSRAGTRLGFGSTS
jgi:hypothetical protein